MKITINKTQQEVIEITCPVPRYVRFANGLYYKYHEQDGVILTTSFSGGSPNYPFDMNVCKNLNIDMFTLKEEHAQEITEAEYYKAFWELMGKYQIANLPNEAPTLHRQNEPQ